MNVLSCALLRTQRGYPSCLVRVSIKNLRKYRFVQIPSFVHGEREFIALQLLHCPNVPYVTLQWKEVLDHVMEFWHWWNHQLNSVQMFCFFWITMNMCMRKFFLLPPSRVHMTVNCYPWNRYLNQNTTTRLCNQLNNENT